MENTVLVLHTSDTHLGYRQYGIIEREKDFYDVFDEIIEIALREHVDLVVHSGDMFDTTRPPPQAFKAAIKSLRRLADKGIPFVVVAGDHDTPKRAILSPLAVLEEVNLAHVIGVRGDQPEEINLKTKRSTVIIHGIRNQKGIAAHQKLLSLLKRLRPSSDRPSILMLHQTLREASPDYELELAELPKGYSYYALGHLHLFKEFWLGESAVVYPGSPEVLRVDEAIQQKDRYVVIAEIAAGKTVSLNKIRLERARRLMYISIDYTRYGTREEFKSEIIELRNKIKLYIDECKKRVKSTDKEELLCKKPLLYIRIKGVPRSVKASLLQLLDLYLSNYILDYRLQIETIIDSMPKQLQSITTRIDLAKIFEERLKDRKLAELALRLIEILGSQPRQQALYEAKQLIAKTFDLEREAELI